VALVLVSLVDLTGVLVQERLGKVTMVEVLTQAYTVAVAAVAVKVLLGVMFRDKLGVLVA
tara:strand:+ start:336 stop:515 length:180 start_codon:yes stop_codon:yes gene_type:complete